MFLNLDTGMTKDRYFEMQHQMGREPNVKDMPPGIEDFPEIVQYAIHIFNSLGDRVAAEIGYLGKDYTNLPIFLNMYEIEDEEFFMELLHWLDTKAIKKSSDTMKKELAKLKRKSSGNTK
jgi:hypothetical protein